MSRTQDKLNNQDIPRVVVVSEEHPERILLETRIVKEDLFQKQQGNGELLINSFKAALTRAFRNIDRVDGTKHQCRHGSQFSRGGGLRDGMVSIRWPFLSISTRRCD